MEAIQFTEEQKRWSETSLELGNIAKSLMGDVELATDGSFLGNTIIQNGFFNVNKPGERSPQLGAELVQNGNFEEKSAELIKNGDFLNDTDDWVDSGASSISVGTHQGRFDVANINILDTSTSSRITQSFDFVNGKTYEISVEVYLVSGRFRVDAANSFVADNFVSTSTTGSWQTLKGTFTAIQTGTSDILIRSISDVSQFYVDSISIKQLDPNDRWTLGGGWSYGDSEVLRIPQIGSTSCTQSINFEASKLYLIEYTIKVNAGQIKIRLGGGGGTSETTSRSSSGTYKEEIFASNNHTEFNLRAVDGAFDGSVLNVSVKEIEAVDIDLWETITNSLDSTIVFSNGFVTLDYDGTNGGLAIKQSNILNQSNYYTVVIDYQMINGEAKVLLGSASIDLTSTTRETKTFNSQATGYDDFSISRKTMGQAMKMVVYSIQVFKSNNVVTNGTGSDANGLSSDWNTNNCSIESSNLGIKVTLNSTGVGYIEQIVPVSIGSAYRLYCQGRFEDGSMTKFYVYNSVSGNGNEKVGVDGVSVNSFTATSTSVTLRVIVNGSANEFIYLDDTYCLPMVPWNVQFNWRLEPNVGLIGNGYGNNDTVQSFNAIAGETYRVEYKISSYTQGAVRVQIGGTNGTTNSGVGVYAENIKAINGGNIQIKNVFVGGDNFIGVIEYIKVQTGEQSDTLDMTDPAPKAIWIRDGGNIKVTTMGGTIEAFNNLPNDTYIDWLRIKRLWKTGTTADGIVGIY